MNTIIKQAELDDAKAVAMLFDAYRVFYQQSSDSERAKNFITERLTQKDSVILLAQTNNKASGFVQLYPSFSSVSTAKVWILNDLYIATDFRQLGVATNLMQAAKEFAKKTKAIRIELATQIENQSAQALYTKLSYQKDTAFYHYALSL